MHIREQRPAAALLCNCYPALRRNEPPGWQVAVWESSKALSLQTNYTVAQNQRPPLSRSQAKPREQMETAHDSPHGRGPRPASAAPFMPVPSWRGGSIGRGGHRGGVCIGTALPQPGAGDFFPLWLSGSGPPRSSRKIRVKPRKKSLPQARTLQGRVGVEIWC